MLFIKNFCCNRLCCPVLGSSSFIAHILFITIFIGVSPNGTIFNSNVSFRINLPTRCLTGILHILSRHTIKTIVSISDNASCRSNLSQIGIEVLWLH